MKDRHTKRFRRILQFQLFWFIAASAFNCLSYISIKNGGLGWAGDRPEQAQLFVMLFGGVIAFGYSYGPKPYRFISPPLLVFLLLGGVVRHIFADYSLYNSTATFILAIFINLFGVWAFSVGTKLAWS